MDSHIGSNDNPLPGRRRSIKNHHKEKKNGSGFDFGRIV